MADPRYREITLQQLLSHTAGMPDVDDYEWDNPQTDAGALKRWVLELASAELLFAPGSDRKYSNIGFEVLGLVVQEVSGVSFEEYLHDNIFEPLQMNNTSFIAAEINPDLQVSGHLGKDERRVASVYPYNRRHAPSSTLNSNIVDMSHFSLAMLHAGKYGDGQILSEELMDQMWAPAWHSPDDPDRMHGLGWNIGRSWGGIFAASHGGHDDGFRSFLYVAPEEDVAIFVVSNDDNFPIGPFIRATLESIFPERAPPD
jgi:CubicO group peptidase (beta-lactamase class C family)